MTSTLQGDECEAVQAAPAGLAYVSDGAPGISRHRHGKGFIYRRPDGARLTDSTQLQRIRSLAVPPAYTRVWICALSHGHLQATGRDARGRKQYRYHPEWRKARDTHKFDRLPEFAAALPRIRARVKRDLALPVGRRVLRHTVLATIVRLLDTTLIRIGNDEYTRSNGSFGLTTLRNRHVEVNGSRLQLRFRGKSGVLRDVAVDDARVARIIRRCQALPGQHLFQYLDEHGKTHGVDSADVNAYLREACGGEFTAKDFRTWHGSVHALALADRPSAARSTGHRDRAVAVLRDVAQRLGNTVTVCRKAYVHPRVLAILQGASDPTSDRRDRIPRKAGLTREERRFVQFLSPANADQTGAIRRSDASARSMRRRRLPESVAV